MSNYIVLVKQVPDISRISDSSFDAETGTLIRSRLPGVINSLDAQALSLACQMKQDSGDNQGRIICLTMGPPMSEDVLRYCLSRSGDSAILLTDKRLSGADTAATANPLAYAIRKIVSNILEGSSDYYIICGMQSVDGDTAQVPPQIAEELSVGCVAYVTGAEFRDGHFEFTCIVSGGREMVCVKSAPAVITVAQYEYPVFATFSAARKAAGVKIMRWDCDDIKPTQVGLNGSKTRVMRVFAPGKGTRKCKRLPDVRSLAEVIISEFKADRSSRQDSRSSRYLLPARRNGRFDRSYEATEKEREDFRLLAGILDSSGISNPEDINEYTRRKILDSADGRFHQAALDDMLKGLSLNEPSYEGEVWVIGEFSRAGNLHPACFELLGKARELADSLGTKVGAVVASKAVDSSVISELTAGGADNVYVIENSLLGIFDPKPYRGVIAGCIERYRPQIVLFSATPQGRILAPMVAYRLGCGLTADCTSLDIADSSRTGQIGILFQTRPALGGNIMATIYTRDSISQMATVRPAVFSRLPPDRSRKGNVIRFDADLDSSDISLRIIKTELGSGEAKFGSAGVIVSGGKGLQNRDNYERLIGSLCDSLRRVLKTDVERGASRAAVERGYAERIYQVGQTGTTVAPKIYIALGISGAVQHMAGISNAGSIIAVNSDAAAPIFRQCDYYITASVEETIPPLIEAIKGA